MIAQPPTLPTTVSPPPAAPPPAYPARHRFSVDNYHRMIDAGILGENDRAELIHGEVITKMPIGDAHGACVDRLNFRLNALLGGRAITRVQNPIVLADSEPEPDVSVVHFRPDFYRSGKPRPADVYLIVEVADSSFEYDRDVKGPLYAANGVPEYWLVNLNDGSMTVYRQPQAGRYATERRCTGADTLDLPAMPGVSLAVADILG